MPNWSSTQIELTFKNTNQAKKVKSKIKNFGFNFGLTKEKPNSKNWYNWRLNHWGTKWNIGDDTQIVRSDNVLTLKFESAWAGPDKWFRTLINQYEVSGYYFDREPNMKFSVYLEVNNGEVIVEEYGEYYTKRLFDLGICDRESILEDISYVINEDNWKKDYAETLIEVSSILRITKDELIKELEKT